MPISQPVAVESFPVPPSALFPIQGQGIPALNQTPAIPAGLQHTALIVARDSGTNCEINQPMPRIESEVSIGPLLAGLTMMVIMRRHR